MLAEQFLVAADKYDIQELKRIFAKELRMPLTVDNSIDLLVLCDLHISLFAFQANELKEAAIHLINRNPLIMTKKPAWDGLYKL